MHLTGTVFVIVIVGALVALLVRALGAPKAAGLIFGVAVAAAAWKAGATQYITSYISTPH